MRGIAGSRKFVAKIFEADYMKYSFESEPKLEILQTI